MENCITQKDIDEIYNYIVKDKKTIKFHREHFGINIEFSISDCKFHTNNYKLFIDNDMVIYNDLKTLLNEIYDFENYFIYYENKVITKLKYNKIIEIKQNEDKVAKIIEEKLCGKFIKN